MHLQRFTEREVSTEVAFRGYPERGLRSLLPYYWCNTKLERLKFPQDLMTCQYNKLIHVTHRCGGSRYGAYVEPGIIHPRFMVSIQFKIEIPNEFGENQTSFRQSQTIREISRQHNNREDFFFFFFCFFANNSHFSHTIPRTHTKRFQNILDSFSTRRRRRV